jgi:hypothetical protein
MPNHDGSSGPPRPVPGPGHRAASAWSARSRRGGALAAVWVALLGTSGVQAAGQDGPEPQPSERSAPSRGQDDGATPGGDEDDGATPGGDEVPKVSRPVAAVLAFVPGLILGGSGHFALGHRQTAYRIFALQGVGAALIAAGAVPLVATAASRYVVTPLAITAIAGVAVASTGWLAEIYGVVVPPDARGRPALRLPQIEAELGYRYIHEAAFQYRNFMVNALDLRWGGWRLRPSAWVALDDENGRLRGLVSHRYFGPRASPAPLARQGSFLEMDVALTHHRYGSEGFGILTGEFGLNGRLDLQRYDRHLAGMFSELGLGLGLQRYDFHRLAPPHDTDHAWLLLARFGFGAYIGRSGLPHGEVLLYYDHRHDGYAAGMTGMMVGIPGHAGLETKLYLSEQLGLRAELQLGAAYVGGLSLLVRQGVTR